MSMVINQKQDSEYSVLIKAIMLEDGVYKYLEGYVRNDAEALKDYFVNNPNCLLHYPIYIDGIKYERDNYASLFGGKVTILARGGKWFSEYCLEFNFNRAHFNGNGFEYNKWRDEWDCMKQLKSDELITYLNAFAQDGIRNTCEKYLKNRIEERERYVSHYNELKEFAKVVTDPQIIKSRLDELFYAVKFLDENISGIRGVLAYLPNM